MEGITFSQNTGKEFYREGNLIHVENNIRKRRLKRNAMIFSFYRLILSLTIIHWQFERHLVHERRSLKAAPLRNKRSRHRTSWRISQSWKSRARRESRPTVFALILGSLNGE